ncbi:MAG: type VI secretion system contractile sheath large subunit, partial [Gammaproteobacteria bacterium]|nr:type VI secretion system contractile sheath large subunit [Gammaproteobacteria bacterium]
PDHLFRDQPLFAELRGWRQRLLNPQTSSEALAEVIGSSAAAVADSPDEPAADEPTPADDGDHMFERLLGEKRSQPSPAAAASSRLDSLLQKVVGPHVVQEQDPKVDTAVDAVDRAIAESMRKILHNPDFQALEGAWRSLYELVQESEIGEELQLKVCNVTVRSLLNGLPASAEAMEECGLYQLLVGRFRRAADDDGFSVLLCNYFFGGGADDVALLATLSTLAEMHDAAVIGAARSELIGSTSLAQQPAASEWSKQDNPFWRQLRESPAAGRIGLALPRILGRLPYGRDTDEVQSFEFEEFESPSHEEFLWLNPALSCARLLAQSFTENGWQMSPDDNSDIGGLPAFTYSEDGEKKMLPCAELLLPERSAEAILQLGIMPIVSFRNRDMARLLRFQSIADPITSLNGPW